jgi:uncharacterized membrane protein
LVSWKSSALRSAPPTLLPNSAGPGSFVISFSAGVAVWCAWNGGIDPYPFILLNLILTVVSTMQSPLIMMSQNRQMERDRDAVQGLHQKLDELKLIVRALESPSRDLR